MAKSSLTPFARFALLGAGIATLLGCGSREPGGDVPVPYPQGRFAQSPARQAGMTKSAATSPEIADRLEKRRYITEELENFRGDPKMANYRAHLVRALVLKGTVSQVPGEYDTVVLARLADYALTLDSEPAAYAVVSLMNIARIDYDGTGRPKNRSVALAMAALKGALKNPLLNADTRQAIPEFLASPEAIEPQPLLGNMPPCCETPQERQKAPDSVVLDLYRQLVPDPEVRHQIYEQMKREHPEQFRR